MAINYHAHFWPLKNSEIQDIQNEIKKRILNTKLSISTEILETPQSLGGFGLLNIK